MRKPVIVFLLLLVSGLSVQAQDCCPKYELSLRYSYFNTGSNGDQIVSNQFSSRNGQNGYSGSFAVNRVRKFDIVADLSYQHKELTINALSVGGVPLSDARTKLSSFIFLFGPRLSSRSDGANFFVHALAGGIRRNVESTGLVSTGGQSLSRTLNTSSTDFALGLGGGMDIKAFNHVAVRLFQFDYIPSRVARDSSSGDHQWSHNYRLQVGIVIGWSLAK
jgi:hypothetical protein